MPQQRPRTFKEEEKGAKRGLKPYDDCAIVTGAGSLGLDGEIGS